MRGAVVPRLAVAQPASRRSADVVVVGAGLAGMVAALTAAEGRLEVELVTKTAVGGGSSAWAQGGVAAAVAPGDSPADHAADTLAAGAGLCERGVVEELVSAGSWSVRQLQRWGARFDRDDGGRLALSREGGHRRPRVVHAGGDATGAELVRALAARLSASAVSVRERSAAVDLLPAGDGAGGLLVGELDERGGVRRVVEVCAGAVVLATGGIGQAFAATTNPLEATGDGLAIASRAGAELRHLELVQFHPTVLFRPGARGQRPLLTEALRGAGAVIRDSRGSPLMAGVHPLGDLAPRDVVAGTMARHLAAVGEDCLWLDLGGVAELGARFPTVVAACRAAGFEPGRDLLPVRPAAHFACGGVVADLAGRTSLPGLLAVGEVAATGAHGANRLASNSLLEAVVAGFRAGRALVAGGGARRGEPRGGKPGAAADRPGDGTSADPGPASVGPASVDPASREATCQATERHAGVLRDGEGLERLLGLLGSAPLRREPAVSLAAIEATNLHTVSTLVAAAALVREESRGCHQRTDHPTARPHYAGQVTVRVLEDGWVEALPPASLGLPAGRTA